MITWQDDMNKLPDDNEGRCKCIFDIIHPSYKILLYVFLVYIFMRQL